MAAGPVRSAGWWSIGVQEAVKPSMIGWFKVKWPFRGNPRIRAGSLPDVFSTGGLGSREVKTWENQ